MNKVLIVSAGLCAISASAAAEETREYDLAPINAIKIATGVSGEVTVGSVQSIRVETDKGDFEDLVVKVENGRLTVRHDWDGNWLSRRKKPRYKLLATVTELDEIDASSGAAITAEGIDSADFSVDASSGANVVVVGKCGDVSVDISSGANVNARDLQCSNAAVDASSGANAKVYAENEADAEASSGALVTVYGEPTKVTADKSSGGTVRVKK
ncbi:MAG: head GIN domain-containing protein [Pseudomonadota bacterium]